MSDQIHVGIRLPVVEARLQPGLAIGSQEPGRCILHSRLALQLNAQLSDFYKALTVQVNTLRKSVSRAV